MDLDTVPQGSQETPPAANRPDSETVQAARKKRAREEGGAPVTRPAHPRRNEPHQALPPEPPGAVAGSTAESEAGRGEQVCAYGVEVVELLEMEPLDGPIPRPRRRRPWHRYASAAFFAVFVLGILNAAAMIVTTARLPTPDELAGGTCEIAGEVRDSAGAPIPNATIVLTDSTRSTFTNADGWYVLKGIPAGTHRVEAAAPGYGSVSVRAVARPNLLRTVDFTLEKGGADVRLDASGATDFGEPASSFLWAAPLLLALSVLALAAAILALRRKVSRAVMALGAASALSFGFGVGVMLAVVGVVLCALQLREPGGPPLKKLRVGISYPRKPQGAPSGPAAPPVPGATLRERYSVGVDELEGAQATEPSVLAEMVHEPAAASSSADPPRQASAGGGPAPLMPTESADIEEVEVYLKERSLRARMASAEIEPSATLGRGEVDREAAPRPRRFMRKSRKGRVLCFVCVNDIDLGQEYLRCSCGKTMHLRCLHEPRCPDCGCSFRRSDRDG